MSSLSIHKGGTKMNGSATRLDTGSKWKSLLIAGGVAALASAILGLIEVIIEVNGSMTTGPTPTTVVGWFSLLQNDRLYGLALLGLFEVVMTIVSIFMFIALYSVLRRANEGFALSATAFALVGGAVYLASISTFSMLSLSQKYATASTGDEQSQLLAAGQALLAMYPDTTLNLGLFLWAVGGIVISAVMLQSDLFGKWTAYIGIVANVVGLPGGSLGIVLFSINGLLLMIWLIMVGARLLRLGTSRAAPDTPPAPC